MKDYRKYNPNLEPQDFTRIHDYDLLTMRRMLVACYEIFNDKRFTDRHHMAERVKRVLDMKEETM